MDDSVALAFLVAVAVTVSMVVLMLGVVRRRLPSSIVRRLAGGQGRVRVRCGGFWGSPGQWNPALPLSFANRLHGRATAVYSLEGGCVRLVWLPQDGSRQVFEGPIPSHLIQPERPMLPSKQSRRPRVGTAVVGLYLTVLAGVGVAVGFTTSDLLFAVLAVLLAMAVLPVAAIGLRANLDRRSATS